MFTALIRYVLLAAFRDRLILALVLCFLVGASLSLFMGMTAVTEKYQFSVVFTGGTLRALGVLGLVLFVVTFVRRSFETGGIEFLLSRPFGRTKFFLSYAAGFSILAAFVAMVQGACLGIVGFQVLGQSYFVWVLSLLAENIIMVNTAFFFAMVLRSQASGVMAALGFYALARMMGQILGTIDAGIGSRNMGVLEDIMEGISMLMPRLDLMGQTSWLIYGTDSLTDLPFVLAQGAIFTTVIVLAALIDLARRQF
ncbi:MAG: hypothetical protein K9G62_08835 [Alphaproteobacteria bacterium]|nr:hypothetical protein [Alphaproteobacteria bacterium]